MGTLEPSPWHLIVAPDTPRPQVCPQAGGWDRGAGAGGWDGAGGGRRKSFRKSQSESGQAMAARSRVGEVRVRLRGRKDVQPSRMISSDPW